MNGDAKIPYANSHLAKRVEIVKKRWEMLSRKHEEQRQTLDKLLLEIEDITTAQHRLETDALSYKETVAKYWERQCEKVKETAQKNERRLEKIIAQMQKENEELRAVTAKLDVSTSTKAHEQDLARASSLAGFDSIIAAIGNWSNDGQVAPDFELLLQSILFPLVYEPIVKAKREYYLECIPFSALEVVKRGREYVRSFRREHDISITSNSLLWDQALVEVREWICNDALPILYGEGSEDWSLTKPVTLSDMLKWRDEPASRALEFPLIFDGMELVSKMGDEIRKHSGLPEFNKQQLHTRIDP